MITEWKVLTVHLCGRSCKYKTDLVTHFKKETKTQL